MSDPPDVFRAKTEAMIKRAKDDLTMIGKHFIIAAATDVVFNTRGFGNQRPGRRADESTDIRYTPTGQLRGGWYWSMTMSENVTYFDGGRESDYGVEVVADIKEKVLAAHLPPVSFIQNDVAYGWIVRWGLGNHLDQDLWILDTRKRMPDFAEKARFAAMRRAV